MNIYVGNLNWNMTSDDLHNLFSPYGDVVSAKIVTDKMNNNRSKGFGFVEMSTESEAQLVITKFNGADYDGRAMTINEAKPMVPRENRSGGFGGGNRDRGSFGGERRNRY